MDVMPENWIDKIFDCMQLFYENRWSSQFKDDLTLSLYKTVWENGLKDLSYDEIKYGLKISKENSKFKITKPPDVIKFYHCCKKIPYNKPDKKYLKNYVPRRT